MAESDRRITPLDESSSRQIWVGWGVGLVCLALAFFVGGIFAPYVLLFFGVTVALRGHFPSIFAKHFDAQIIAGIPYRREESLRAWGVAMLSCVLLAALFYWIHLKVISNCVLSAVVDTEIVARLYVRGIVPANHKRGLYDPYLQELFYDWTLKLQPNCEATDVRIIFTDYSEPADRVRTIPSATINAIVPKWFSGFNEPSRKPDYYARTVLFPKLVKGQVASIVFRKPIRVLDEAQPTELALTDLIVRRVYKIETPFRIDRAAQTYDRSEEAVKIPAQFVALWHWRYSGKDRPPVPVKRDPDAPEPPLDPNEAEATFEARCNGGGTYKTINISNLEARREPRKK